MCMSMCDKGVSKLSADPLSIFDYNLTLLSLV